MAWTGMEKRQKPIEAIKTLTIKQVFIFMMQETPG
jgi:hypothetical protein